MTRTWLCPPYHFKEQISDIKLTKKQEIHAEPTNGYHRIRGVIGSGKTLVLAYRAAALAKQGKKVLVITFNKTLWHYIRDMVQRTPFGFDTKLIIYKHFHKFCNDFLNEMGCPKPHGDKDKDYYLKNIVPYVREAFDISTRRGKNIEDLKYDAILIDEGQDFEFEWYEILCKFLKQKNELVIMCDKAQNIYGRELNWIYTGMKGFTGRWGELDENFRLPPTIVQEANRFAKMYLPNIDMYAKDRQTQLIKPELRWISCDTIENALNQAEAAFDYLVVQKKQHPTDIVFLFPEIELGQKLVDRFQKRNIEVNDTFCNKHKKSFWMGDSRTKVSTIHSFKGWELANIVLIINNRKTSTSFSSLIYTAIGRTQKKPDCY
jgi:Superfamily I DNA and RNA helicases